MIGGKPMGIHNECPWRDVVQIAMREGPKGGEYWVLTLSCGHYAFRRIAKSPIGLLMAHAGKSPKFAPHRARCLFCGPLLRST